MRLTLPSERETLVASDGSSIEGATWGFWSPALAAVTCMPESAFRRGQAKI